MRLYFSVMEGKSELSKLSEIDQKIIRWMVDNAPSNLQYWIDHLTPIYAQQGIILHANRLFEEVTPKLQLVKGHSGVSQC